VEDRGCIFAKDNTVEAVDDVILNAGPSYSSDHYSDGCLKQILQDLVDSADDTGCSEDLTVVSRKYVDWLRQSPGTNLVHKHRVWTTEGRQRHFAAQQVHRSPA
jgi:hypothetical protein